ncbi:hypothetical protein [Aquitalea sp. LB_tupeE]|uniref:hypothetical protein n=1 Tax=Aquitalea sp. LB_tupeE TaxID=2748078 RepID=UPI0015B93975|nr:hypothetical protein [Aquitalea sp. LB_tupeE]NWK79441.1 hypothetical protein [Aquitalea sp. LB_tupeE]
MNNHSVFGCAAFASLVFISTPVLADVGNSSNNAVPDTPYVFSPYVKDVWDSNLQRAESAQSDQIKSVGVTAGYANKFSQQNLSVQGSAERQFYTHRDDLNHTDLHSNANWNGIYGDGKIYTQLSGHYDHTLIDQSTLPQKNFLTAYGGKAAAGYLIDKNYSFELAAGVDSQRNSMESQKLLDYDDDNLTASFKYQTARNSSVRLYFIDGRRDYLRDDSLSLASRLGYDYQTLGGDITWQITEKSAVSLGMDHTKRRGAVSQVSGEDINAGFSWQPTSKLSFIGSFWISHPGVFNDDRNPNYERGIRLQSNWLMTEKITMRLSGQHTARTYDNFSNSTRYDTLNEFSAGWLYAFTNKLSMDTSVSRQNRKSNLDGFAFVDRMLSLQLQYKY